MKIISNIYYILKTVTLSFTLFRGEENREKKEQLTLRRPEVSLSQSN